MPIGRGRPARMSTCKGSDQLRKLLEIPKCDENSINKDSEDSEATIYSNRSEKGYDLKDQTKEIKEQDSKPSEEIENNKITNKRKVSNESECEYSPQRCYSPHYSPCSTPNSPIFAYNSPRTPASSNSFRQFPILSLPPSITRTTPIIHRSPTVVELPVATNSMIMNGKKYEYELYIRITDI
ncbi:hypothetical protein WA158_006968 [Blastocystis sp. Blastoise]